MLTCLKCGGDLTPTALGPQSAPYVCLECHHAYFAAELSQEARPHFRKDQHDFGRHTPVIRDQVRVELEAAHARGTSAREENP